jgi:hypothetical protein
LVPASRAGAPVTVDDHVAVMGDTVDLDDPNEKPPIFTNALLQSSRTVPT